MIKEEDLHKLCEFAQELNGNEVVNLDIVEDIANALGMASGEITSPELMLIPVDIIKAYKDYVDYVNGLISKEDKLLNFDDWYQQDEDDEE